MPYMISWQAATLNAYLRLTMKRGGNRPLDAQELRDAAAGMTRFLGPVAASFQSREVNTDGGLSFTLLGTDAAAEATARVVLYLHGGGFIFGSPQTHQAVATATAEAFEAPVYALKYRLAPEHPFPAAIEDATGAYEWLLVRHPEAQIVLAGDSAGGGLALATAMNVRARALRQPAAIVAFSAWCDLALTGSSIEANARRCSMLTPDGVRQIAAIYLAGADPHDPRASPLYGDVTGLPAMLLFASRDELLLDDTERMAVRAAGAGATVQVVLRDDLPHAWPVFVPWLPEAREAFVAVAAFAQQLVPQQART